MRFFLAELYWILSIFLELYITVLLLRLLFQKLGASWHNPISQFVIRFTEPVIKPVRKIIPGFKGFDLSILFLAILFEFFKVFLMGAMVYASVFRMGTLILMSMGYLGNTLMDIFMIAIIVNALLSWFPLLQNNGLSEIVRLISNPIVSIFRRYIPPLAGMDFSPLFAVIALYLINVLIFDSMIAIGVGLMVRT